MVEKKEKRFEAGREAYKITKGAYAAAREAVEKGEPVVWSRLEPIGVIHTLFHALGIADAYPENWGALCAVAQVALPLLEHAEADGFINTICGYGRNGLGYARRMCELEGGIPPEASPAGGMPRPTLLVGVGHLCEAGFKWWQSMRRYLDVPFYAVEMIGPPVGVELEEVWNHYLDYQAQDMRSLVDWLERQTGRKMDTDKLSGHVAIAEESWRLWYECCELRKAVPASMAARDYWSCIAPGLMYPDMEATRELYRLLYKELKDRVDNRIGVIPEEKYRYLWYGLPPWHSMEILDHFESLGAVCVVDVWEYHPKVPAEVSAKVTDPYKRLAWKSLHYWSQSHKRAQEETGHYRNQQYLDWVREYRCDGAVLHNVASCRPVHVGLLHAKDVFMRFAGIPSMIIEGDLVDPRVYNLAQVEKQAEAFVETMESHRKLRRR